jgi:hypothetical protein
MLVSKNDFAKHLPMLSVYEDMLPMLIVILKGIYPGIATVVKKRGVQRS